MAKIKKNIAMQGLSGMLGGTVVYRTVGRTTIVQSAPERTKREPTEGQKKWIRRFQEGVIYAKKSMENPSVKAAYEARAKEGQSGYQVALTDYLKAPDIDQIDFSGYDGTKGSRLIVKAMDDYMVAGVNVEIYQPDGTLLEKGVAELHENGLDWVYTAQQASATLVGSRVVARATDMPGNTSEKEHVMA